MIRDILWCGKIQSMIAWSKELGIPYETLKKRFQTCSDVDKNLRMPLRVSKTLTYNGETMTYKEWEEAYGAPPKKVGCRVAMGWSPERIFKTFETEGYRRKKVNPSK